MTRGTAVGAALVMLVGVVHGCGDDTKPLGAECSEGSECTSGRCERVAGARVCTELCTPGQPCPSQPNSREVTCREGGLCGPLCTFTGVSYDGYYLCDLDTGVLRACGDGDDVEDCAACGCAGFGGGVCISEMGCIDPIDTGLPCPEDLACETELCDPTTRVCVEPAPAGSICTLDRYCASTLCDLDIGFCVDPAPAGSACASDRFCESNICDPTTHQCVALLPLGADCDGDRFCASGLCSAYMGCFELGEPGDACFRDQECATLHCSTDGITTSAGVCLLAIGAPCAEFMAEPHCDRCIQGPSGSWCQRQTCHEVRGACSAEYACRLNTMGTRTCFERCDYSAGDACSEPSATCLSDDVCDR